MPIFTPHVHRATHGGVFLSHYHSLGQWEVYQRGGFGAVWDKYLAPLDLKGRRVVYWYPFSLHTPVGYRWAEASNAPSSLLWSFGLSVKRAGAVLTLYLPLPNEADALSMKNLFMLLPRECPIVIDMLNGATPAVAEQIEQERARGRTILGEPHAMKWNARFQTYPYLENSDHLAQFSTDPSRFTPDPWVKRLIAHHEPLPANNRDGTVKLLTQFVRDCTARGDDWLVPAEPLVNARPGIQLASLEN